MEKEKIDNRMGWIRNLEKLKASEDGANWEEYEVASECYITGRFDYENGKISCQLLMYEKDKNGLYQYLLRIKYCKIDRVLKKTSSKGYCFAGGVLGELLSLFSVFFQCRFYHMATYCILPGGSKIKNEEDFFYKKITREIHPTIFNDESKPKNFADGLGEFLDSIKKLENAKHQGFILACSHYARSLKEVGQDSEMVFMRLVSSIEALSKNYKLCEDDDPLYEEDFERLFKTANLTQQQCDRLRETLKVEDDGKIKITEKTALKFRQFVKFYSQGFVYIEKSTPSITHTISEENSRKQTKYHDITSDNLEEVIKNIYHARSKYLHEGEPMHLSLFMRGIFNSDFDFSLGGSMDNRSFSHTQILPYPHVFENLVRHCLLEYLET